MKRNLVLLFLVFASITHAQKLKKEDKQLVTYLQQHITYLADDKLEGRRTGTKGEKLAMEYISWQFKNIGLLPKGSNDYYQPFEINEGKQVNPSTHFIVNDQELVLNKEYFPLVYSPNIRMEVLPSVALQEADMPWFWNINELLEENAANPHFDLEETIRNKAKEIKKKSATALFVYNTSSINDGLAFNAKDRRDVAPIPIVYITKEGMKKYFSDESATLDVKMGIDISDKKRPGSNVIGFIDNGAANTVVLGAHFDHLGYGEDGNGLTRNNNGQVFNGADDNASGTAALIELARLLKASKLKNNNYLFIAFSGEELGLYGSKYFTEHPTVDLASINYMINMDMVGRLNDSSHTITVGGYGTSPVWATEFALSGKSKIFTGPINFRFDSSGTGPSDHTSFYTKGIPVLFYFTGLHSDYHRTTDDADKINYNGEMYIVKHIFSLLEATEKQPQKLAFTKTREAALGTEAHFTVTLGFMPDYTFSGNGVRIDDIISDRPAQKSGLKAGDVITKLGDYNVSSMESYMQALARFKKGDKTIVYFNRASEKLSANLTF